MKFTRSLYLLALTATAFTACSREESAEPDDRAIAQQELIGTYDFLYLAAHTESDMTMTSNGESVRSVTISDYISKENTGTYEITADQIKSTGIGYKIDTTIKAIQYDGGTSLEFEAPFVFSVDGYSSVSSYRLIGADSIYSDNGIASMPSGNGQVDIPSQASGSRFFWSGDTLTFYGEFAVAATNVVQGATMETKQYARHAVRLLKRR